MLDVRITFPGESKTTTNAKLLNKFKLDTIRLLIINIYILCLENSVNTYIEYLRLYYCYETVYRLLLVL